MARVPLAVIVALMLGAGSARAALVSYGGFSIDSTRTQGTGALAGWDVVRFIAINNGINETAGTTRLQAITVTESVATGNLKLDFRDLDGDGIPDPNLLGSGLNANSPTGSYIRIGPAASFNAVYTVPPLIPPVDPVGPPPPNPIDDPRYTTQLMSIRVDGFQPPSFAPVATGSGVVLAAAVVPAGTPVYLSGALAAEGGQVVSFNYVPVIPEPATFGLLTATALGAAGGRRCRRD
jgi:hypothetical protein